MTIGLITEPKSYTRKYFLSRIFKLNVFEKAEVSTNPFNLNAEILPFSKAQLKNLSPERLENLIYKKIRRLNKRGITKLILSDYIYWLCQAKGIQTKNFANGNGKQLFFAFFPLCLRQTAKKANIDLLLANVCIRVSKMDRISQYLIRELCFDTKKMYLCTKNLTSAQAFCESFCDETGLWIDVIDKINFYCDVILDIDSCELKIGNDLYIRDAKFDFDFCGYNVSHTDAATLLTSANLTPTGWVYSYEK